MDLSSLFPNIYHRVFSFNKTIERITIPLSSFSVRENLLSSPLIPHKAQKERGLVTANCNPVIQGGQEFVRQPRPDYSETLSQTADNL